MPVPFALEKASLAAKRPAKYSIFRCPFNCSNLSISFSVKIRSGNRGWRSNIFLIRPNSCNIYTNSLYHLNNSFYNK